jgi:hypothetical protein
LRNLAESGHLTQVVDSVGGSCYLCFHDNEIHLWGDQQIMVGNGDLMRDADILIFPCPSSFVGGKVSRIAPKVGHGARGFLSTPRLAGEYGGSEPRGKSPVKGVASGEGRETPRYPALDYEVDFALIEAVVPRPC